MHRESRVAPRLQQLDALVGEQALVAQAGDDLVAKQQLGRARIDVRHRDPRAIASPAAPRDQGVYVRAPLEKVGRRLHHRNHARPGSLPLPRVARGLADQFSDRLPGGARQLAEELSMVQEVGPQHLRDGKDPLRVTDRLEDLLFEQSTEDRGALGRARRAEGQAELGEILDRLEAWAPTAIAVEWDRDDQDRLDERYSQYLEGEFEITSNEIYQIGFRLGKRLGHQRLWAVDAESRFFEPRIDREQWAKEHGQEWIYDHPWDERFQELYSWEDLRKTRVPLRDTFLYMNSAERLALGHGHYLVGGFKAGDGTDYPGADHLSGWWYVRNLRIVSSLLQLARQEDDRVLLIVGAGHVPILRHAARSAPDVELVEVSAVLK